MPLRTLTVFICAATLLSCGSNGDKRASSEGDAAKGQHRAENNQVEVVRLEKRTFRKQIVSNGRLAARSKSVVGFRTQGVIEHVYVSNGSHVRQGDILAELDKTEALSALAAAQQNLEKARIDLSDAIIGFGFDGADTTAVPPAKLATAKVRSGYNVAVLNLANARNTLKACTLHAPFAGKVADVKGRQYEAAAAEFCTVVDDSQMEVDFSVVETELGLVRQGGRASVVSFVAPDAKVQGVISSINPVVDDKGQIRVRAKIAGRSGFMDGMNVKVYVENEIASQLVLPKSAVVIRDNLEVVFRYSAGRAIWTYVHTLMDNSEEYVVEPNLSRGAELSVGDTVIVSGNLNLANDSKVELKKPQ
ncbi:MAG: efflux RND transporter periplasmic adaptor subunit [Rikenellaceae bacterium]|jgi:RND family efflux transporter MFP subunit|nr:efflux RND transporter periplasmic adaptor subunit [Rikenellaceae bacterium]